ncbi:helix-turn-helix domain-containing protein [Coprococcus comes]|uniref:helix-turn-helix domain-containing protein n=1 Tax=Coprococcus comes TaxID=410072 RepID=UPI001570595B|nr:PucR family transcriptional regulator [Coprococcus comes]
MQYVKETEHFRNILTENCIAKLECYLNHKQSIRKTSELMGGHSRSVSYRLQKIVELTGMDFENIAEMLSVRNRIVILRIL